MAYATVRAANSPELAYIRTTGQWSRLHLAFLNPPTVYTAILASLPSSFDSVVEIAFTSGSGTLANVLPGMTLYVGTAAGAYDLGMARIRKAPIAGTFYIGEESEIDWEASCHLTVVADFDLWAKHIRTISDSVFHMDWDVAYTDQNAVFDPIPIMGGHRVLKLTGASVSTIFDFSNSYVIDSTISAYSLSVPTSSGLTGETTATPTVTFDTPGWHPVYLTVTAANGKTHLGVRYVYVYSSASMPVTDFQLGNCSVDYETGGWSFEVTMQFQVALADVPDRALCILFAEDFYGDTQISIGQLSGCENILCVGRISEESMTINPEQSEVRLRIHGLQYWLSKVYAFPTGVILTASTPANWATMQSTTARKVIYRLLRWGTTVTTVTDVYLTDDARIASELTASSSNIWGQLQELGMATIQARPGVDRFGRLFVEVEPQLVPSASRTWATVMTLTKVDWQDAVNLQRVTFSETGMVNISGVVVDSTGSGGALFGLSPGHIFKRYGNPEVVDRMLLLTQDLTNQQAGLFLGWRSNPYPNSEFKLASGNRMIDCFPRQKIAWSIEEEDTPRAFALSGNFVPRRVELHWDEESGFLEMGLSLELESIEHLSMNGDIPGNGDVDLSDPPEPSSFPDFPDFDTVVVIPSDIPLTVVSTVLAYDVNEGLIHTLDFDVTSPHWGFHNGGFAVGDKTKINAYFITPNGAVYALVHDAEPRWSEKLYRAPAIGQPFVLQLDLTWLSGNGLNAFHGIGYNPFQPEQVAFITSQGGAYEQGRFWLGSGVTWVAKTLFTMDTNFSGPLSYGAGKWVYNQVYGGNQRMLRFNSDGSSLEEYGDFTGQFGFHAVRAGTTAKLFKGGDTDNIYFTDDNADTITEIYNDEQTLGLDSVPDGTYLMGSWTAAGRKGRSNDGGFSWGAMPNLVPGGTWQFRWAGGSGVESKWIATNSGAIIRYTEDWGSNWTGDKNGDLTSIVPIPAVANCVVFGLKIT